MKFTERAELVTFRVSKIVASILATLALCALLYAVGTSLWIQFQGHAATLVDNPAAPTWQSMREPLLGVSLDEGDVADTTDSHETFDLGPFASDFDEVLEQFDSLYGLSGRKETPFSDKYPRSVISRFLLDKSKIPEEFQSDAVAGLLVLARDMAADPRLARIYDSIARTDLIAEAIQRYSRQYATTLQEHLSKLELQKLETAQWTATGTREALHIGTMAVAILLGSLLVLVLLHIESHIRGGSSRAN